MENISRRSFLQGFVAVAAVSATVPDVMALAAPPADWQKSVIVHPGNYVLSCYVRVDGQPWKLVRKVFTVKNHGIYTFGVRELAEYASAEQGLSVDFTINELMIIRYVTVNDMGHRDPIGGYGTVVLGDMVVDVGEFDLRPTDQPATEYLSNSGGVSFRGLTVERGAVNLIPWSDGSHLSPA